jgi:hypothetical protein
MKHYRILFLLLAFVMSSCTSFRGVKPLYPEPGNPGLPSKVDSLQPTFRWEPSSDAGVTYDFIVYECLKVSNWLKGTKRSVGREIYYRQGLNSTEHKIEEPLKPDSEYFWSIRTRQGEKVSSWSLYDYTLFLGMGYTKATNQPFLFKTPDQ